MSDVRIMKSKPSTSVLRRLALGLLLFTFTLSFVGLQSCNKEDNPVNKEPLFQDLLVEQVGWNSLRIRGRIQKGEEKIVQTGLALAGRSNAHITECQTTIINSDLPIDIVVNRIHFPNSYVRLYVITSTNIYYSAEFILKEASTLSVPYKGGTFYVAHRNTDNSFRWALTPWNLEGANDSFDGRTNQQILMGNNPLIFDAARHCQNLVYGGYDDWYLPSAAELQAITKDKSRMELFNIKYWSSTEESEDKAYLVNTSVNTLLPALKDTYAGCRCIRRD